MRINMRIEIDKDTILIVPEILMGGQRAIEVRDVSAQRKLTNEKGFRQYIDYMTSGCTGNY